MTKAFIFNDAEIIEYIIQVHLEKANNIEMNNYC